MKTVEQVLKEYRNRQSNPEIESMGVWVWGGNHVFTDVTNVVERKDGIEFDYSVGHKRRHFSGCATILNKVVKIND